MAAVANGLWIRSPSPIRDPGNLGTIIRSADAAGAEGVVLIGDPDLRPVVAGGGARVDGFLRPRPEDRGRPRLSQISQSWQQDLEGPAHPARTWILIAALDDYRKADYALPLLLVMELRSRTGFRPGSPLICRRSARWSKSRCRAARNP